MTFSFVCHFPNPTISSHKTTTTTTKIQKFISVFQLDFVSVTFFLLFFFLSSFFTFVSCPLLHLLVLLFLVFLSKIEKVFAVISVETCYLSSAKKNPKKGYLISFSFDQQIAAFEKTYHACVCVCVCVCASKMAVHFGNGCFL